jgi:hypothetical protein
MVFRPLRAVVLLLISEIFRKEKRQTISLSFSSMQPFRLKRLCRPNYGEMSTEKCMALFRRHNRDRAAKPNLAVSSTGCPERLHYKREIRIRLGGGNGHVMIIPQVG